MVNATLEALTAPANHTRTNGHTNGHAVATHDATDDLDFATSRNLQSNRRARELRKAVATRKATPKTEQAIREWEAASEAASRLYGEMNAVETEIMDAMYKAGIKSLRLSDGRMLVVLEYFKSPNHPTGIYTDAIQILPAGVIPE